MKTLNKISLLGLLAIGVLAGCDKTKQYDVKEAEPQAHFKLSGVQNYSVIVNPAPAFTVTVGTTDVADVDREVGFQVVGTAGAIAGTDYTITPSNGKVIIPAGQATADIKIQANYSSYINGEKDTLTFTLKEPSVKVADFSNTLKVALRGPCFEGDVTLNAFLGSYTRTNELWGTSAYGPYTTTISNVTSLTATTATITVTNIFDFGWAPIKFTLDWTNAAARTVTPETKTSGIADAGTIDASFAGMQVAVRPFAGNLGTFSACNGTVTLRMQLGVTGLGWFTDLYTVSMVR